MENLEITNKQKRNYCNEHVAVYCSLYFCLPHCLVMSVSVYVHVCVHMYTFIFIYIYMCSFTRWVHTGLVGVFCTYVAFPLHMCYPLSF